MPGVVLESGKTGFDRIPVILIPIRHLAIHNKLLKSTCVQAKCHCRILQGLTDLMAVVRAESA